MLSNKPVWFRRSLWALMILAAAIRFFYWGYTHRTWEDALITVLHSENAANGLGLTHLVPPGEGPLHGFTSPLSVLIPLVGDLVHPGYGLELLKLVSALIAPVVVLLAALISLEIGLPYALCLTASAFVALEHHQILWGMAGMETEVVTAIYLFSLWALLRGSQWVKGISLGLLMLARPDAALWVAPFLLIECRRAYLAKRWRDLVPVVAGLVLLYGPWLVFTTLYYGSPVPNTVLAKGMGYASLRLQMKGLPVQGKATLLVTRVFNTFGTLGPSYGGLGTGLYPFRGIRIVCWAILLLFVIGAVVAVRRRSRAVYVFLLASILGLYLLLAAPNIFGWYTAPLVAVAIIGCCYGGWSIAQALPSLQARERVFGYIGAAYILLLVMVLPTTFRSDKYVQTDIEGMRKQMGLFLAAESGPNDTIASESLGYVGYYSRRIVYDYPGLCSRRVVQYLREYPQERSLPRMMYHLEPTFLVLRPYELSTPQGQSIQPWLAQNYDLIRTFKLPWEAQWKIHDYWHSGDREFLIFRRKDSERMPTPGEGAPNAGAARVSGRQG